MMMMIMMMAMELGEKETREAVGDNLMRTIMVMVVLWPPKPP